MCVHCVCNQVGGTVSGLLGDGTDKMSVTSAVIAMLVWPSSLLTTAMSAPETSNKITRWPLHITTPRSSRTNSHTTCLDVTKPAPVPELIEPALVRRARKPGLWMTIWSLR